MTDSGEFASNIGIGLGIILVGVGVGAYVVTDFASPTALIPAFFGVVIVLLGVLGRQYPDRERLAIYGMGVLAVLGILGSLMGIPDIVELVTGGDPDSTVAPISQGLMILISLGLLALVGKFLRETR